MPLIKFSIVLSAELLLCAALNLFDDWTLEAMPVRFVTAAMLCGVAYLAACSQFSVVGNIRKQALTLWLVAIALRVAVLPLEPGDDFWRYQWEGKIQSAGFNPYVTAPDDPQLEAARADFPQWYRINHRDFRAIYPPGAELLFAALSPITESPLLYKLIFAAADLATIAVLLRLISGPARYVTAAWYAWNPLTVYCFAGAAHFDSVMILPLMLGILFLTKQASAVESQTKWQYAIGASIAFGVAISMKLIPLLLLPLCVFALGGRALALVLSLAIPGLLSFLYGYPQIPIWESLGRFAYVTRLNDLFWWVIEDTVWPNPRQKNYHYNVVVIACVTLVSLIFYRNWKRGMLWALGLALILSPVLHPWYCLWILPLAAWRGAHGWHVLSVTLFAYFLFWNERLFALPWRAEPWLRGIIIVPALVATAFSLWHERSAARAVNAPVGDG